MPRIMDTQVQELTMKMLVQQKTDLLLTKWAMEHKEQTMLGKMPKICQVQAISINMTNLAKTVLNILFMENLLTNQIMESQVLEHTMKMSAQLKTDLLLTKWAMEHKELTM